MSILFYSQPTGGFSDLYLSARKKENRIFPDEQVAGLPNLEKNHIHYEEWQLRKKSANRFMDYLKSKNKPLKILDIGCGNGWFSHLMSTLKNSEVTGLDVNTVEMEQAAGIFQKPNLTFVYADLYENTELNSQKFDIIVFNSCFQYFENVGKLLGIVSKLLAENGEIHIIDTPFYNSKNIENAKQRTKDYYADLGFSEMAKHYFHHRFQDLEKYKIMYKPSLFAKLLNNSPFCWIKIDA